jgi:hypothetical protein
MIIAPHILSLAAILGFDQNDLSRHRIHDEVVLSKSKIKFMYPPDRTNGFFFGNVEGL